MNAAEAAIVLAKASAYDRRTIGESDALAWAEALEDIQAKDAAQAVTEHYKFSTEWIMPAHVRRLVEKHHEYMLRFHGTPDIPDGLEYQRERTWRHMYWVAARSGQTPLEARNTANAAIDLPAVTS